MTFSYNVAEVEGQVALPDDPPGDLTVILVDESKDATPERIAFQVGTDQKGRFRMVNLAPGSAPGCSPSKGSPATNGAAGNWRGNCGRSRWNWI